MTHARVRLLITALLCTGFWLILLSGPTVWFWATMLVLGAITLILAHRVALWVIPREVKK